MSEQDREDYAYGAHVWHVTWQALAALGRFATKPFRIRAASTAK
jgi:hypothetical protein